MPTIKEHHGKKGRDSPAHPDKRAKKDSGKGRKSKRKISDVEQVEQEVTTRTIPPATESKGEEEEEEEPKQKKSKKSKKSTDPDPPKTTTGESTEGSTITAHHRFIVFIGNLPYTTTHPQLQSHFSSLQPSSVRLITDKAQPGTCKGFAFLEFTSYDRMKSCLAKYHHSVFLDRKINVELTAGGGGAKSKDRREKLRAKNERLNGQRRRRIEEEEKLKGEKRAKRVAEGEGGNEGVHQSRRGNIKA